MKAIIYDNHPLILNAICSLLEKNGHEIVTSTISADELIYSIMSHHPDLVFIDPLSLSHEHLKKLSKLNGILNKTRYFVYSGNESAVQVMKSMRIDVRMFVSKTCQLSRLHGALDLMEADSRNAFCIMGKRSTLREEDSTLINSLTQRELQMLRFLSEGKNNTVIAGELKISNKTVSTYKRSIMRKMHTQKISDVVDLAVRNGFV